MKKGILVWFADEEGLVGSRRVINCDVRVGRDRKEDGYAEEEGFVLK